MLSSAASIAERNLAWLDQESPVASLGRLQELYGQLSALDDSQPEADKMAVEELRLKIMRKMLSHMRKMLSQLPKKVEIEEKHEEEPSPTCTTTLKKRWANFMKRWAKPLYVFLMLFNVAFMAIGGFLGMQEVLADIPGLAVLTANVISAGFTLCECAMAYSISGPYVKKGLGIPEDAVERTMAIVQDEQREVTEAINRILLSPDYYQKMNYSNYHENSTLASLFNEHVSAIQPIEFQEPWKRKGFRWFLGGVNIVLIMTNCFYMTGGLLKLIAPALMGTPVGWGIIAAVILIQVVVASIMRSESMYEMLNPEVVQIKEVNKKIKSFENQSESLKLTLQGLQKREALLQKKETLSQQNKALLLEQRDSSNQLKWSVVKGANGRRYSTPSLLSRLTVFTKPVDVAADADVVDVAPAAAKTVIWKDPLSTSYYPKRANHL